MADQTLINTTEVLAIDETVMRASGSDQYGVTIEGFIPKPFARLLSEKIALARALFGMDIDLTSGSVIRKLLELTALEDARMWADMAAMMENNFVTTATGTWLDRLGAELGLLRPYMEARGQVKLKLEGNLPAGFSPLTLPRGSRMYTSGGHHVELDETVTLSATNTERNVAVVAFYPGSDHNLDPNVTDGDAKPQKIQFWYHTQDLLADLVAAMNAAAAAGQDLKVTIDHTQALTGGEMGWSDARYRDLLLRAPRSIWTVDAIRIAVSLVPGVRQVQVRDGWGGLDINQSIFGNFNFIERVFGTERDLGSPYYFDVLVAPTISAIWDGVDGLRAAVEAAIEPLRPISIFPRIERAQEISVGIDAKLIVRGIPLPTGSRATVNASPAAQALKWRLIDRIRQYVDHLPFGEPVRGAEVTWAMMNEPGIVDVQQLHLLRFPGRLESLTFDTPPNGLEVLDCGINMAIQANQIATLVDDISRLEII